MQQILDKEQISSSNIQLKPNLFVVGAPKCGTTALCNQLAQHPEIFIPNRKEFQLFASDTYSSGKKFDIKNIDEYEKYFVCDYYQPVAIDGSTWYLFSHNAPSEIRNYNPNSKIVILVRDPIRLVKSLFDFRKFIGLEKAKTLSHALSAEKNYLSSKSAGPIDRHKIYRGAALFSDGIKRFHHYFGRDNVLVIFHEEFKSHQKTILRNLYNFIEVDENFVPKNITVNKTYTKRSETFSKLLTWRPRLLTDIAYSLPSSLRKNSYRILENMNKKERKETVLDEEIYQELIDFFKKDVEQLSKIMNRDLSHWMNYR